MASAKGRKNALVLAGGAARGAYEVGVVDYVLREVARDVGPAVSFDILCGTSVGALNSCLLAAYAHRPGPVRAKALVDHWRALKIEQLIRLSPWPILRETATLFGYEVPLRPGETRRGGVLDSTGIEQLVTRSIPFDQLESNLERGHLDAITVSTTHVGTGRTIVFVGRGSKAPLVWGNDPTIVARATTLRAEHALASAAIPFLFPAVRIGGEFHCDGGLRQNVPLSPARRLGATGLIVVSPRKVGADADAPTEVAREEDFPSAVFLLGKALNALLLDRVENDVDRLKRINAILEAGARHYGPGFLDVINRELQRPGSASTRPLRTVLIRASEDIGKRASDFVRSNRFLSAPRGLMGRMLHRFADSSVEADLLSYVLFDGNFAAELIELGRTDAKQRHEELCAFFTAT